MDYSFITECRERMQHNGWAKEEQTAYDQIVNMLFRLRMRGKEKARQLDEYDGESLFGNTTLYPGQIYAFIYKADKPSIYDDGKIKFTWSDSLPIVLVTHIDAGHVRGINLNLCSTGLRAFILNALHNLDLQFYSRGNLDMYAKGRAPISNNVAKVFMNKESELKFFEYIKNECKLEHSEILYRTYAARNIKEIRMLEVWQHKYIPFLTYNGDMKADVLKLIHQVTKTDMIKL